jgi:hypothetical protein
MRHRAWWVGGVILVLVVLLPVAAWGLHRHAIASSVLSHPVLQAFEMAAEERSWTVLSDERRTPGIEPLWLASMMEDPYRRELILETDLAFYELGPSVEELVFDGQRWPPVDAVYGAQWRPSGATPVLNRHLSEATPDATFRGALIGQVETTTHFDRARTIWIEVRDGFVAVTVEGGVRRSSDGIPPPPTDPSDVPPWHGDRIGPG